MDNKTAEQIPSPLPYINTKGKVSWTTVGKLVDSPAGKKQWFVGVDTKTIVSVFRPLDNSLNLLEAMKAYAASLSPLSAGQWRKAINDEFPTVEKEYHMRQPSNIFTFYVVPHAIDKEGWKDAQWEWLDETPIQIPDMKIFVECTYDEYLDSPQICTDTEFNIYLKQTTIKEILSNQK